MNEVFYLYGFTASGSPAPPEDLVGLEDRPVEALDREGCRVLYSRLPAETYGEGVVEERLKDLGWVAPRGVSHERVVTWFVDRGGIVPAPFLTLYSSREALEAEVRSRAFRIRELLDRVAGLEQWDLKVSYDPERVDAALGERVPEIGELDREIATAAPGRRYLLERRRAGRAGEVMGRMAEEVARDLLEELGEGARAVRSVPLPRGVEGTRVVLTAALLVDPEASPALRAKAEERGRALEERGFQVSFSGPWAPYRFVADEEADGPPETPEGEDL